MKVQYLTAEAIEEFNAIKATLAAVTAALDEIERESGFMPGVRIGEPYLRGKIRVVASIRKALEAKA